MKAFGGDVEWIEATKACRILVRKGINVKRQDNWNTCFDWYWEQSLIFKKLMRELDK